MADKKKPAPADDDGRTYVVGEPSPEAGPSVEETVAEVVKAKPFGRPKPKYCARPNCGLRPEPGSRTCAHHRGWTP